MTTYTIQQLETLVSAIGEGSLGVQVRAPNEHAPYKPPPLKRDIRRAIYNAVYDSGRALSLLEISQRIGVKKTTWVRTQVECMVDEGHLIRTAIPYRPGMPKYMYEVAR